MKSEIPLSFLLLLFMSLTACTKDNYHIELNEGSPVKHITTELAGCNYLTYDEIAPSDPLGDTLIINYYNDTLSFFAGINYICCAPFTTDYSINKDSILLTITDTCSHPYQTCYCRCMCYYTFNFYFENIDYKRYYYRIILRDPREEEDEILYTGIFRPDRETKL